jgi:hypothetical protein
MKKTNSMSLVLIIAGIMMCSTLFKSDALAGPKGDIIVRDLGNIDITIDGSFSDWPLDKFKKVSLKLKPTTEAKENPYHSASYSFVADGSDAELVFSATAAGDATLLLDAVSVGKAVDNFVANGSFETDDVPASPGYGDITDWTGGSGINDGGPFGDNGVIPDGAKLAFLQGTRMLSQQLTELEDGAEYVLAFYYNARSCCGGTIDFTVLVGDQELGSVSDVRPVGGENAYHSASYSFVADGSDPELVFSATAAGDATLLLDAVSVSKAVDNFVANGSFETDDVPASPGYGDITDWTGGSGINDGGPFGDNGVIPDGEKLAFVQGTKMLSQQLTGLEDGAEYVLDFYYNARNCCGGTIDLTVSVGGEELGSVSDVRPVGSENAVIEDTADASGDHIVFDRDRIGRFNGTGANAWQAGDSDFGSTVYFAHNDDYLYMLAVFIDDVYRMERDTSEYGATGYLNDGFEFFLDTRNNSDDCASEIQFPSFDPEEPNVDDFQLTVALNENFKPEDSPDDVLGVRQTIERGGDLELIGPDKGGPGGIYRDALDAVPGVDIAAKSFADLRAAGALNPEILANPNVTYSGYTVEMLIPFGKFTGFTPDHSMGFELFWRDVDTDDDEGKGGGNISWGTWGGETTVDCGNPETSLFHTSNWGQLIFDTANQLDEDGGAADPGNLVANGSFEADDVPAFPGYRAITGWTGGSGINDGGPFGDNGVIPDGAKLVFIQGTKAMSQQLTGLEAGAEYVLAFYYNARGWNAENSTIGFTVSVGGQELGSVSDVEPVGGENAYHSASYSFVAAASDVELVFSATADGDATLLLDAVSVGRPGKGGGSISIAQTGTQVTLEWLGELETAENVTGPWAAIEASSPLTFSPSDLARYYRGVQADIGGQPGGGDQVTWGPTPIFIDDLESGAEGWTHKAIEDGEDPWELGTPSSEDYGPVAAASGQNVWGTVLDDRYPDYSDASLRTPPIDLTGMEAATLVYTEFRDVEAPEGGDMYDMVQINILSASNPDGETLADELRSTAGSLRGWVSRWVKLPEEVLGEKIIIEFRFISDDLLNDYAGWYIDDVMVLPE